MCLEFRCKVPREEDEFKKVDKLYAILNFVPI